MSGEGGTAPSFYASVLEGGELADLSALAEDLSLDDEMACARIALRRVLTVLSAQASEEEPNLSPQDFARLGGLAFQGTSTIARLPRDRRGIRGDSADGISGAIAQALDELPAEWGCSVGIAAPAAVPVVAFGLPLWPWSQYAGQIVRGTAALTAFECGPGRNRQGVVLAACCAGQSPAVHGQLVVSAR
ncbi:hypothetical protein ACFLWA_09560 [Chloroflexota bacterium]